MQKRSETDLYAAAYIELCYLLREHGERLELDSDRVTTVKTINRVLRRLLKKEED